MSVPISPSTWKLTDWIVAAGVTVLAGLTFFNYLHGGVPAGRPKPTPSLKVGALLGPLTGSDQNGAATTLRLDAAARPTFLYVFTPTCGWCKRNVANLKAVMSARNQQYSFVGISLSDQGVKSYLAENGLRFDRVLDRVPVAQLKLLAIRGTPTTIVVGRDGRVLADFSGAYDKAVGRNVARFFALELPGLLAVPAPSSCQACTPLEAHAQ